MCGDALALATGYVVSTVTGHPVDIISGYLYTEAVDFEFPGPIPLRWERLWNSTSIHHGALGYGWHHRYDLALVVDEQQGYAALRGADGRGIAFDVPTLGMRAFNRLEKLSLLRDKRGYGVLDHGQGLTYRFGPAPTACAHSWRWRMPTALLSPLPTTRKAT